jgi:ATP-binding cassette subfamily B protein
MFKFLKYLKPYWFFVLLTLIFVVVEAQFELKLPEYISQVMYAVMGYETDPSGNTVLALSILVPIMIAISVGACASAILSAFFSAKAGAGMARDMRKKVFDKVQGFSMEEIEMFSTGSLITRSTNDINQVQMTVIMALKFLIKCPAMAITAIIKVVRISPTISGVIGIGVLVLIGSIIIIFAIVIPRFKVLQKCTDNFNKMGREELTGIRVIRDYETEKYEEVNDKNYNNMKAIDYTMGLVNPLLTILMNGLIVVIMLVAAVLIKDMKFTDAAKLSEFFGYTMHIVMSFMFLTVVFILIPRGAVSAKRINEVLETETKIKDKDEVINPDRLGTIEFKDVSFKYPDGSDYVLTNISFTANKGETVAFIGSTGSGKSTVVNLIPRFYDVSSGSVLVDGVDVKDFSQHELRDRIGFIPQKGVLFSGSIKDNIDFAGKNVSDEVIEKSAKIAQASEFIDAKDEKYNYYISQGGQNVSGGQKQRLAIARALAKESEIYIFDDTFSALDFKTDKKLRKALKKEMQEATCLIVAQRIGTIMDADKIIVLDEGKIVGMGKHKELLKSCDVYKEIALSQLSEEEINNAA